MKPYGMTRLDHGDLDAAGCAGNGRAARAYHSLRGGKKARARRLAKRAARRAGAAEAREEACGGR